MLLEKSHDTEQKRELLEHAAERLRRGSLISTDEAGSGHPTSCLSCAEIMSVLFFEHMRLDANDPDNLHNDQFVLSKGHAAPILWSAFYESGLIDEDDLRSLRQIDSEQEGHPTPRNPWVKVATGSLGQGFPMALGMAWSSKLRNAASRTYVLLGDGETSEGSVWEAASLGAHLGLDNLTVVVDINRHGQSEATMLGHDIDAYHRRFAAFGWNVIQVDGHDVGSLSEAFDVAKSESDRPTVILAATVKGKGVSEIEGASGNHGKPAPSLEDALGQLNADALKTDRELGIHPTETHNAVPKVTINGKPDVSSYEKGDKFATREAFGKAMLDLGGRSDELVALDGDVKNSTKLQDFFDTHPDRSVECYIAEQVMAGMAIGMSKTGCLPCAATFAAFLTRAFDQLRMGALSRSRMIVAGSHAGVAIGEDGPTQMGLEDFAMMRALPNSIVFHPADAVSTHLALEKAAQHDGISYLRLTRGKLATLYDADEDFPAGEAKVHGQSEEDRVTLVGAGTTLHECLAAQKVLRDEGIQARVVDCYSLKPLPRETLKHCVEATGRLVIAEDHYPEGGLGEAIFAELGGQAFEQRHLAVRKLPRSGASDALLADHGIDADAIAKAARELAAA